MLIGVKGQARHLERAIESAMQGGRGGVAGEILVGVHIHIVVGIVIKVGNVML